MNIFTFAEYILNKYPEQVTPMKLQKLLYYVKAWSIIANKKVIDEPFYAWKHGPVNREVYDRYKRFGSQPITGEGNSVAIDNKELVDFILESYAPYNAVILSKTTHAEKPWLDNKDSQGEITDNQIIRFYRGQTFAKNFPINQAGIYYPPHTASYYSFIFDMNEGDEAANITFSSLEEYVSMMNNGESFIEELGLN